MLDTRVRRVARLEQQAIEALATDGPGGACSTTPGFVAIASGGLMDLLGLGEGLGEAGAGSDDSATQGDAQVAGQSETSAAAQSSDGPSVQLPLGLPAASPADLAGLTVIVVVLCFAGGFFVSGTWKELSSRRTAQHH
jgi:hypothetical protein